MLYVLSLAAIVLGEVLIIYSEMVGARAYNDGASFTHAFLISAPAGMVAALLLIVGYILGYKAYQNIWIVSAFSVGSILMVEPLFNYFYMGDLPTLGASIGFGLGALGILATFLL